MREQTVPNPGPADLAGRMRFLRRIETRGDAPSLWAVGVADEEGPRPSEQDLLSADELERANKYYFAADRTRFVLARAALRLLLGQATETAPERIAFTSGAYGKPGLVGRPDLHFNLSHSGSLALIGISPQRPIGVDIEIIRDNVDELALARSFFCEDEHRLLCDLGAEARLLAFYKIWTCKEAVLKAFGVGISTYLNDFSVRLTQEGGLEGVEIEPRPGCFSASLGAARIEPVAVEPGYVATFALA